MARRHVDPLTMVKLCMVKRLQAKEAAQKVADRLFWSEYAFMRDTGKFKSHMRRPQ